MELLLLSDEVFCRDLKGSSAQLYSFVSPAGGETMGNVFTEFLQVLDRKLGHISYI